MTASTVTQALAEYEAALRTVDAPVLQRLRPGASAAELDAAEARAGFPFPADARAVRAWHNGSAAPAPPERMSYLTPGSWLPDLDQAVDRSGEQTEEWVDALGEASGYVGTRLIGLTLPYSSAGLMVIDCADPDTDDAPAVTLFREGLYTDANKTFTVTATVNLWTSWILDGWWRLRADGAWDPDPSQTPVGPERHQF